MVGTAVFRIVVSSDSMKNATAINHGSSRLLESASEGGEEADSTGLGGVTFVGVGCIILRDRGLRSSFCEKPIIVDSGPDSISSNLARSFRNLIILAS
jgi:hypothetical protein